MIFSAFIATHNGASIADVSRISAHAPRLARRLSHRPLASQQAVARAEAGSGMGDALNAKLNWLPSRTRENTPPDRLLANPPVPLAAATWMLNLSALKPLIAPDAVTMGQFQSRAGLNPATSPLRSGLVPASDQRLSRNGLAAEMAVRSRFPSMSSRSQWVPAIPLALLIC
jgi:hypothetical protein